MLWIYKKWGTFIFYIDRSHKKKNRVLKCTPTVNITTNARLRQNKMRNSSNTCKLCDWVSFAKLELFIHYFLSGKVYDSSCHFIASFSLFINQEIRAQTVFINISELDCSPRLLWGWSCQPVMYHCATQQSAPQHFHMSRPQRGPLRQCLLTPRWIQISEDRGLWGTVLIPSPRIAVYIYVEQLCHQQ